MPRNNRLVSLPKQAHPAVVDLFEAIREQRVPVYQLAEKAGVSDTTIWAWGRGIAPRLDLLEATLNVVGCTLAVVPLPEKPHE